MNRIEKRFKELKEQNRSGLITFISAGDPDKDTSQTILNQLPHDGADIIELGMPFSDPMADGLAIQNASIRALDAGASMKQTLEMVRNFRSHDPHTPLILMGYYNPIYIYGTKRFTLDAKESGVDGLIIVDLPPEEDSELREPMHEAGLELIRLITPTTDEKRLELILNHAGGFLYYVSITGITGTNSPDAASLTPKIQKIKEKTDLPVAIGFGIKTPDDIKALSPIADAVVVGSAIVDTIAKIHAGTKTTEDLSNQVKNLKKALI